MSWSCFIPNSFFGVAILDPVMLWTVTHWGQSSMTPIPICILTRPQLVRHNRSMLVRQKVFHPLNPVSPHVEQCYCIFCFLDVSPLARDGTGSCKA